MHILLTSDTQLEIQKAEAIEAFRRGELDRSAILFEGILAHWPLDSVASKYLASIQEFNDWGIDPVYLAEHWERVEALMNEQEPLVASMDSHESLSQYSFVKSNSFDAFSSCCETPAANELSNELLSVELPRELRIVLELHQQGRRKAARMWVKSYMESTPDSQVRRDFLLLLPQELLSSTTTPTNFKVDVNALRQSSLAPHDSRPPSVLPVQPVQDISPAQNVTEKQTKGGLLYLIAFVFLCATVSSALFYFLSR